jgi:hypothetical protein
MTLSTYSYLSHLLDRRLQNYLMTLGASLAVVFVALLQRGELLAAVVPVALAAVGLLLRWTFIPAVVVFAVCYLLIFPTGLPFDSFGYADIRASYFESSDLLFIPAILCYLSAQYRLFSLTVRAIPDDRPSHLRKRNDPEPRRPMDRIPPTEMPWLFAGVAAATLMAQFLWLALTKLEIHPAGFPPIRLAEGLGFSGRASQFVLLAALMAVVGIFTGLVFWYWRLATLNSDEARLMLLDTGWAEVRRELARLETWRAWKRPGARRENRMSPWPVLRTLLSFVLSFVAIGIVLRMIWPFLR